YRRLATTILRLDVPTITDDMRAATDDGGLRARTVDEVCPSRASTTSSSSSASSHWRIGSPRHGRRILLRRRRPGFCPSTARTLPTGPAAAAGEIEMSTPDGRSTRDRKLAAV